MKVLFTGPILDFSGFGHASRDFLRALAHGDHDMVARPLKYDSLDSGQSFDVPDWMRPLLLKDLNNVNLAIQMTTSNIEAVPIPGVCNALYTFLESDRLQRGWVDVANTFDFLMVPCRANAEAMVRSGVQKPILLCAPSCDAEVFKKEYAPLELPEQFAGRTVFYNICQLSGKKGIDALLRSYYAAFADCPDDVLLVLKTYVNMMDRRNDLDIIREYINMVKVKCRIPAKSLPPVLPIIYTMSDDEIHGLHTRGDAYVCSSRAEGWGLPVFDALGHGNTVITNTHGGLKDFVRQENALIYGGTSAFFYDVAHPDPGLFTGVEQCFEPSTVELGLVMRKFHLLSKGAAEGVLNDQSSEEWAAVLTRRENGVTTAETFDYKNTSPAIWAQLDPIYEAWSKTGMAYIAQPEQPAEQTEEVAS